MQKKVILVILIGFIIAWISGRMTYNKIHKTDEVNKISSINNTDYSTKFDNQEEKVDEVESKAIEQEENSLNENEIVQNNENQEVLVSKENQTPKVENKPQINVDKQETKQEVKKQEIVEKKPKEEPKVEIKAEVKEENKVEVPVKNEEVVTTPQEEIKTTPTEEWKVNNSKINEMIAVINNNPSEDMLQFGYNVVSDSSIVGLTTEFTYSEKRVKDKIAHKFGTIKVYARDYYLNGQYQYTECYII